MKECRKCHHYLPDDDFYLVKQRKKGILYTYRVNQCRNCRNNQLKEYYDQNKNKSSFKSENRRRVKIWRLNNLDYVTKYLRKKRATDAYKNYVKEYNIKNKDKIRLNANRSYKRYIIKQRDLITDSYAKILICRNKSIVDRKHVTSDMIETKKIEIAINRLKKIIKNHEQKN